MKIILTNDDGIYAEGIHILAGALAAKGHEVTIVAPDRERSACGHGMTMDRPVNISKLDKRFVAGAYDAYKCDALPTDCVTMACDVLRINPDLLISGINDGPNMADDLTYSGTVCAAMEGIIMGIPSIAVSLVTSSSDDCKHYESAAATVTVFMDWMFYYGAAGNVLYNINVPNLALNEINGLRFTKKGIRKYTDRVQTIKGQHGKVSYWIGGKIVDEYEEGSDVTALRDKFISVTPVHLEMTDFAALKSCSYFAEKFALPKLIDKNR